MRVRAGACSRWWVHVSIYISFFLSFFFLYVHAFASFLVLVVKTIGIGTSFPACVFC